MYEIVERYNFTATHQVRELPGCHSRAAVHLHRWTVEIGLRAAVLPRIDGASELAELEPVRRYIGWELDGKYLNELLPQPPTPVWVAGHLTDWCVANLSTRSPSRSTPVRRPACSFRRTWPNRDGPVRSNHGFRP